MVSTSATEIESAIAEAKTALGGEDVDAMNNSFERLQTASHKLAEAIYSQTPAPDGEAGGGEEQASSASAGADGGHANSESEGDVIDAEYVDVEPEAEDKK